MTAALAAVAALEGLRSPSHWPRESGTVDSLRDAICGGTVVAMAAAMLLLIEAHIGPWNGMSMIKWYTTQRKYRFEDKIATNKMTVNDREEN